MVPGNGTNRKFAVLALYTLGQWRIGMLPAEMADGWLNGRHNL